MKKVYTFFITVLMTVICSAQAPQKLSYQAVIRNASDQLVTNHTIGLRISILQSSSTGTPVYVETQTPTTNANGLATIEIGGGTPVTGAFVEIDWSNGSYFIKTETDLTGGTTYSITGTTQILSVPYALYAKTSGTSTDAVKIIGDQTVGGNKTFSGITTVSAPVNSSDAATKAYVDALRSQIEEILLLSGIKIKDFDGNVYKTVTIGTQVWMAENLKTTRYNDGSEIPYITDNSAWSSLSTPGYCWYNNDATTYKDSYGALYNSYAMDIAVNGNKNACPIGWHVSTYDEWNMMSAYLVTNGYNFDGTNSENKIAKSLASITGWTSSTYEGTPGNNDYPDYRNKTGLNFFPGGQRTAIGQFGSLGFIGHWWATKEPYPVQENFQLWWDYDHLYREHVEEKMGFSVRCLKD